MRRVWICHRCELRTRRQLGHETRKLRWRCIWYAVTAIPNLSYLRHCERPSRERGNPASSLPASCG